MKYAVALVALAASVMAVPTNGGNDAGQCNNNNPHYVCCNGLIAGLLCNINLLGNSCGGGSYCCKSAPQAGLINIGLDCVKL
ncbi:hypothetical protein QQS21_006623 [Conoideocrella luteorostrata]|uniref:Uncharacterized protein n=1 Tax=Conoideocrella luteorostrata TaxID=1105319 RepID=A0AAJ0CN26_9HYPO|nr:hypothetical protein QQS21_006623 [Conoideocrella luteorostrata]